MGPWLKHGTLFLYEKEKTGFTSVTPGGREDGWETGASLGYLAKNGQERMRGK